MVVVYVIVVLWLVSANFRSSLSSLAQSGKRNIFGQMVGPLPHLRDDGELESLIVVRDKGQKKNKAKCTTELDHEDDGDYVWEKNIFITTTSLHIKIQIFYRMLTKQRNILLKPQVV